MELKRGDITNIEKLSPGDRFYKMDDKGRKSYEFIGPAGHGKFQACKSDKIVNGIHLHQSQIEVIRSGCKVAFLRNVNQLTQL